MESVAGESHLVHPIDDVQPGKDIFDPAQLIMPHLLSIAAQEQATQSPMPEGSDHASLYGVNYRSTGWP